jgi:hypothetical protein
MHGTGRTPLLSNCCCDRQLFVLGFALQEGGGSHIHVLMVSYATLEERHFNVCNGVTFLRVIRVDMFVQ